MKAKDSRSPEDRIDFETLKKWLEVKLGKRLGALRWSTNYRGSHVVFMALSFDDGTLTSLDYKLSLDEQVEVTHDSAFQKKLERMFVKQFMSRNLRIQHFDSYAERILTWYPEYRFAREVFDSQVELELAVLGL